MYLVSSQPPYASTSSYPICQVFDKARTNSPRLNICSSNLLSSPISHFGDSLPSSPISTSTDNLTPSPTLLWQQPPFLPLIHSLPSFPLVTAFLSLPCLPPTTACLSLPSLSSLLSLATLSSLCCLRHSHPPPLPLPSPSSLQASILPSHLQRSSTNGRERDVVAKGRDGRDREAVIRDKMGEERKLSPKAEMGGKEDWICMHSVEARSSRLCRAPNKHDVML